MISYIFAFFFIVGISYGIMNNINISNVLIESGSEAIKMIMNILPVTCLWIGIMNIAKNSGLLDKLSKLLYPILKILFPEIPKDSICFSYIATNIIMNMFGMGNAATAFGLKTISEMQKINDKKDIASRSMITFLVMNTAAVTIMPSTIIGIRLMYGSIDASNIIPYVIITSSLSCLIGLIIDRICYMVTLCK